MENLISLIINMKTPEILEESGRIGSADFLQNYCPEYYSYYVLKNVLCFSWIFASFIGFFSYKKKSRGLILSFIIMNFIAILFKGMLEVSFTLQEGPCNSVIKELAEEWDDEYLFTSKLTGALYKWETSQWNTVTMILCAILSQFCSLFLRKKSFGYSKLDPSNSSTLN